MLLNKNFIFFLLFIFLAFYSNAKENVDSIVVARELPELNIVSIKQSSNLQNQPISSSSFGIETIQRDNIFDIKNLSDLAPNLYIPEYGSRITSTIYVRGIGARMDQPSVGLTIDNLPVLNKDAYDLDIPDIAEIEMLRGPQSSLYGRNTIGGLINIRTLSPINFQGLRLLGEGMINGSFRLQGGWYHRFKPNLGFSANVALNSLHADHKNLYNNSPVGVEKSGSLRTKFEWLPTSALSILNTLSASLLKQTGYAYQYIETHEINYNDTCFYKRFLVNDALTLNYNFSNFQATGIFSVQHIDDNMTLDQDFLPLSYFTLTQKKQETDFTAELLAQRSGRHKYHWLGGLFAFYRHLNMQAPVTFKDSGIKNLIEYYRNNANPYYPIRWDSDNFLLNSDFTIPSFGVAIYHESRFEAGQWRFSAALRLDYEKIKMRYQSNTNTAYTIYYNPSGDLDIPFENMEPYRNVPVVIDDDGHLHMHFLTLLPKASVLYEFESGIGNVYATFGKGYKAGGYNTQMFSDVLQQRMMNIMGIGTRYDIDQIVKYKPEYSFNYEIGAHLDFKKLSSEQATDMKLDFSIFYIDCRDQQLTMFPEGNTTGRIMTNAGRTRSFGGEISVSWNPWSSLVFNGSYGYTNAKFLRFFDGKEDFRGKRLPYVPDNTLYLQCLYIFSNSTLKNNRIVIDMNLRGTGSIYWNESNSIKQPFYALLGAGFTFKAPKWEVEVWGRNLTCTKYNTFYFMSMGNEFLQKGNKINAGLIIRIII